MQVKAALELLADVLGMSKTVLRERQSGGRDRALMGIAQQRQNRVIEGRSRDLDASFLRRLGVSRQHTFHQRDLVADDESLVFQGIVAPLSHQFSNFGLVQKKFVKPRE